MTRYQRKTYAPVVLSGTQIGSDEEAYCRASRFVTIIRHLEKKVGSDSAWSHAIHGAGGQGESETSSISMDSDVTARSTAATDLARGCRQRGSIVSDFAGCTATSATL